MVSDKQKNSGPLFITGQVSTVFGVGLGNIGFYFCFNLFDFGVGNRSRLLHFWVGNNLFGLVCQQMVGHYLHSYALSTLYLIWGWQHRFHPSHLLWLVLCTITF